MRNKGFTLIELLAVIVILAIIALIATPIILNIINDTKSSADKRSIELYKKSVENAVSDYMLNNNGQIPTDAWIMNNIDSYYNGNRVSCDIELESNGRVNLSNCTVTGSTDTGNTQTIVYRYSTEKISIGDTIDPSDTTKFTTNSSTLGSDYYLKHVTDVNNEVIESYVCARFNNKETCLRGGSSSYYGYADNANDYTGNVLILKNIEAEGLSCYFTANSSYCEEDYLISMDAYPDGKVSAFDSYACVVSGDGSSWCDDV